MRTRTSRVGVMSAVMTAQTFTHTSAAATPSRWRAAASWSMNGPTSWVTSISWGEGTIQTTRGGWASAAVSAHAGWFQRYVLHIYHGRKDIKTRNLFFVSFFWSTSIEAPIGCASTKSQTSAATWWSSWMTVPVCLTVSIIATSTLVMLWMATGSSMSTPITEADSTSWELESTGDTATGVQPVPLLAPSRESLNFSHGAKCCCKYLKVFIKHVEFFRLSCVSFIFPEEANRSKDVVQLWWDPQWTHCTLQIPLFCFCFDVGECYVYV